MANDTWFAVLSAAVALVGLGCLYAAFFLTEPEERRAQETLEKWWIIVDDTGHALRARLRQLAHAASKILLTVLSIVFGSTLLSLRAFWAAACLSLAAVIVSADNGSPLVVSRGAALGFALILIALAVLPPPDVPRRLLLFGCGLAFIAAVTLVLSLLLYAAIRHGYDGALNVGVEVLFGGPALLFGTLLHLFWVAFLRWAMREFDGFQSTSRTLLVVVLIGLILYLTVVIPPLLGATLIFSAIDNPDHVLWFVLPILALLRGGALATLAAWPVGIYLAAVALLLVFRVTWPLFPRVLYAAQRHRIVQNHVMLAKVGVALLVASGVQPLLVLARVLTAYIP